MYLAASCLDQEWWNAKHAQLLMLGGEQSIYIFGLSVN